MKKLVIFVLTLQFAMHTKAQVSFPCQTMQNSFFPTYSQNAGIREHNANCWEVIAHPFPIYGPVILENNAQTVLRANKSIHLKEGFQAKNFTSIGYAHFTLGDEAIEPFIMNLGSNVVGKHKKIEIGFKMPDEIENQVFNYLYSTSNFLGLNPYDPNKISIEAEFKHQSGSITLKRHGFYYEYFEKEYGSITTNGTIASGGLIKKIPNNDNMLKWRVRFAPTEVGFWYGTIKIYINGSFYADIVGINFECVPSNEHGYLEVGAHNRQFRFSDDSTSFYAIGQNLTWPTTLKYLHYSNVLSNGTQSYQVENGTEEWLHTFRNLGDNGGNFARTVFYPGDDMNSIEYAGGQEIEWEKLGDYQSRQHCMFVLDEVFDIAEQKGIFIMLTPNIQNEFADKWAWNPYNTISSKNNNNPIKLNNIIAPWDFLSKPEAKEMYKRKLRYIHSRWGYGPHLAAYELISEMNNWTGWVSYTDKLYYWQREMQLYYKNDIKAKQLISSCYYGSSTYHQSNYNSPFAFLDFTSQHDYQNKKHSSIERQKNRNDILNDWDKPSNFGEMGMTNPTVTTVNGSSVAEADPNDYEKCDGTEWHNALWATAFMEGYGAGLNWWANDIDAYRAANFPAMKQFFSNVVFEADQWTFNQHWSNDNYELNWPVTPYNATREVFAMTTNSSHKAMGWVHQATNWWGNKREITGCKDRNNLQMPISNEDGDDDDYSAPGIYLGDFQLTGLVPWTQYQVDFYRTDDGAGAWYSSQFVSSSLLGTLSPAYPGTYFDFAFKASKSGVTFRDSNNSNTPYLPKPDTLACNTKSVKINYVWFNDTLGTNKYEWTWGDNKSTEQFPEITFGKAGNYNVKLIIIKPDNTTESYQQLIVIPECTLEHKNVDSIAIPKSNECLIFPNPTNNKLTIVLKENANYLIDIIDSWGKLIKVNSFKGSSYEINCDDISTGLYFIKVYNNTVHYNSKFIKL